MRFSVVIPVFNESATLEELLARVDTVALDTEVVLVDDGSTDGTREILSEMARAGRIVVFHDTNQGKGAALRTGFMRATGDYVIIRSPEIATALVNLFESKIEQEAWEVFLNEKGKLRWRGMDNGQVIILKKEPQTTWAQRFMAGFYRILPIRGQL